MTTTASNMLFQKSINNVISVSWVKVNGTIYKPGMIVKLSDVPLQQFGKINHILVANNKEVSFVSNLLKTVKFVEHLEAFEVENTNETVYILHKNSDSYKPRSANTMIDRKCYVIY